MPPRLTVRVPVAVNPGAAAHSQLAAQLAVYRPARLGEMFSALGFDGLSVARSRLPPRTGGRRPQRIADRVLGALIMVARLRAYAAAGADCRAVVPATAEDPEGRVFCERCDRRGLRHRWRQRWQTVTSIVMAESR